jgi:hypothetical protein
LEELNKGMQYKSATQPAYRQAGYVAIKNKCLKQNKNKK